MQSGRRTIDLLRINAADVSDREPYFLVQLPLPIAIDDDDALLLPARREAVVLTASRKSTLTTPMDDDEGVIFIIGTKDSRGELYMYSLR